MRPWLPILLGLALAVSCRRPPVEEMFVKVADRDGQNRYCFPVALDDPAVTYDLDILIGMDCTDLVFSRFIRMPLRIQWTDPSGRPYEETVWVGRDQLEGSTYYQKNLWLEYRHGMRPVETGTWELALFLPEDQTKAFNVTGTGIRLQRNGTR